MSAAQAMMKVGGYTLTRKLATGGMADVWLARPPGAGADVVLKFLLPELVEDPEFVRMFGDEARLASLLEHRNIVRIFDRGQWQHGYFIAMEHVAGKTLRQLVQRVQSDKTTLPPWFVLTIAASVCDALDYAHACRDVEGNPLHVVHRDVSPDNIIVGFDGRVKVLDFGIAKASTQNAKTRVGVMKGKHAYMAPEQILTAESGCTVDHRADLYSLGVVMYEMLTTRRPFEAENELGLIRVILESNAGPAAPCELAPWLLPAIGAIVMKALERDPDARFESAAEMGREIDDCLGQCGERPSPRHVGSLLSLLFREEPGSGIQPGGDPGASAVRPATASPRSELDVGQPSNVFGWGDQDEPPTATHSPTPIPSRPPIDLRSTSRSSDVVVSSKPEVDLRSTLRNSNPLRPSAAAQLVPSKPPRWPPSPKWPAAEQAPPRRSGPPQTSAPVGTARQASGAPPPASAGKHSWDTVLARMRPQNASGSAEALGESPNAEDTTQGPSGPPLSPERRARREFERGLDLARARRREEAIAALERAVELDPDNRLYRSNLKLLRRPNPQ